MARKLSIEAEVVAVHQPVRVLIVDDHEIVRKGLRVFLQVERFHLVGEAGRGIEAVELCGQYHPDVVLMDLSMPHMGASRQQASFATFALKHKSLLLPCYLFKNVSTDELADAIRAASVGQSTLSSEAFASLNVSNQVSQYNLTPRESESLHLMVQGLNNREIGEKLFIAQSTVKNHVTNILAKLGVNRRSKTVALAVKYHLVEFQTK